MTRTEVLPPFSRYTAGRHRLCTCTSLSVSSLLHRHRHPLGRSPKHHCLLLALGLAQLCYQSVRWHRVRTSRLSHTRLAHASVQVLSPLLFVSFLSGLFSNTSLVHLSPTVDSPSTRVLLAHLLPACELLQPSPSLPQAAWPSVFDPLPVQLARLSAFVASLPAGDPSRYASQLQAVLHVRGSFTAVTGVCLILKMVSISFRVAECSLG